jgi:multicomponent Na+:H+ antiporter subunit E
MAKIATLVKETLIRFSLFSLLWGTLIGSDWEGWLFGVPVIALTTYISLIMVPRLAWKFRPLSLLSFSIFFFWHALRGGIDVIGRAFHPYLPINPGFLNYEFRLPPGSARVFLVFITSLLPGTLSSFLQEDQLVIHALDIKQPLPQQIQELEEQVANLFGTKLFMKKLG